MAATAATTFQDPFQNALNAVETLPRESQQQLAKRLLLAAMPEEDRLIVIFHQLPNDTQARMDKLMARNNEGIINPAERNELVLLTEKYEKIMLGNTRALLRAVEPDLFTSTGHLVKKRMEEHRQRV